MSSAGVSFDRTAELKTLGHQSCIMRIVNMKTAFDWTMIFLMIVTLTNFIVFTVIALYLGGTAMNGRISEGHFYLGQYGHYLEVSRHVFIYSQWHGYSVFVTFVLSFIAAFFMRSRDYLRRKEDRP